MRTVSALIVLGACLVAGGCAARFHVPSAVVDRVERGAIGSDRVVFAVVGLFGDNVYRWHRILQDDLARLGVLVIPVEYTADPVGVWLGYSENGPAQRLADAADAITAARGTPPEICAIGFSFGGEVILEAARRMKGARFARVVFHRSSHGGWSAALDNLLASGRIGAVRNTSSAIDLHTMLTPFGAGTVGLASADPRVASVTQLYPHAPLFPSAMYGQLIHFLLGPRGFGGPGPDDPVTRRRVTELLRGWRDRG